MMPTPADNSLLTELFAAGLIDQSTLLSALEAGSGEFAGDPVERIREVLHRHPQFTDIIAAVRERQRESLRDWHASQHGTQRLTTATATATATEAEKPQVFQSLAKLGGPLDVLPRLGETVANMLADWLLLHEHEDALKAMPMKLRRNPFAQLCL